MRLRKRGGEGKEEISREIEDGRTSEQRELDAALFSADLARTIDTLDLHGKDKIDAIHEVDAFLDAAFMRGTKTVRIVHGKGSGVLRETIRRHLANHLHVAAWRPAPGAQALAAVNVVLHSKV